MASKITIYVDGSYHRQTKIAGWGLLVQSWKGTHKDSGVLREIQSSGQAELVALIAGLRWLSNQNWVKPGASVLIRSDCQGLVNKANLLQKTKNKKSQEEAPLWEEFKSLLKVVQRKINRNLEINWVKGHHKTTGNLIADALAKQARTIAQDKDLQ